MQDAAYPNSPNTSNAAWTTKAIQTQDDRVNVKGADTSHFEHHSVKDRNNRITRRTYQNVTSRIRVADAEVAILLHIVITKLQAKPQPKASWSSWLVVLLARSVVRKLCSWFPSVFSYSLLGGSDVRGVSGNLELPLWTRSSEDAAF